MGMIVFTTKKIFGISGSPREKLVVYYYLSAFHRPMVHKRDSRKWFGGLPRQGHVVSAYQPIELDRSFGLQTPELGVAGPNMFQPKPK